MEIKGNKTKAGLNGPVTEQVNGLYAGQQVRIYVENPFGAPTGTLTHLYKCYSEIDGLLPASSGGSVTSNILDEELLTKTFAGVSYPDLIAAIKECCTFIAERNENAFISQNVVTEGD